MHVSVMPTTVGTELRGTALRAALMMYNVNVKLRALEKWMCLVAYSPQTTTAM